MNTKAHDHTDWAIPEALASGTTPEQLAHNIVPHLSGLENKRLVTQLLIDRFEMMADEIPDDEIVKERMNDVLTAIAVDVQTAIKNYL